ncbi:MAG: hypothetical protein ABL957_00850 [Parvularculaceae bacterium]
MRFVALFLFWAASAAQAADLRPVEAARADEARAPAHALGDAVWTAPDTDIVAFLTETPGECLTRPTDKDERYLVELGRAAFRNPLLLGGPAARYGLSCNSCHRDGRANPDFFLAGLSGEPGTADVTSALFSKTREDGTFNPRKIPDLVGSGRKSAFGSGGAVHNLEDFIGSAVTEEFQGAAPPDAVLAGLAAYVRRLDAEACPTSRARASLSTASDDLRRAMAAADAALARDDAAAASVALLAAQQELKRIHARFASPKLDGERALIETFARELAGARAIAAVSPRGARERLDRARLDGKRLAWRLHAAREDSLYDEDALRDFLRERP